MDQSRDVMVSVSRLFAVFVVLAVVAGAIPLAVTAASGAGATEPTGTPTATPGPTVDPDCEPADDEPTLRTLDIVAVDDVIEEDDPGQVTVSVGAPSTSDCPVVVQVLLDVPEHVYVDGDDLVSGSAGLMADTVTVEPGETRHLAGTVYASQKGTHEIDVEVTYFPEGHVDAAEQTDAVSVAFDANETTFVLTESAPPPPPDLRWFWGLALAGLLFIAYQNVEIELGRWFRR